MSVPSLSSSAILALLSPEQQENLYYVLKKKHYERRSKDYVSIQNKIGEIIDKYFDLVWYARKDDEDREEIPAVDKHMTRIEELYPEEIHDLVMHNTDWSHGFNSGALAISRLLSGYAYDSELEDDEIEKKYRTHIDECDDDCSECEEKFMEYIESRNGQIQFAEDNFPMLDT